MARFILFLFTAFFVVIRCFPSGSQLKSPSKEGLRLLKKDTHEQYAWTISRDDAHSLRIQVGFGSSKQITLSDSTPFFVRKYDKVSRRFDPYKWEQYSWRWQKKHKLIPTQFILLKQKEGDEELWLKPNQLSLALKKGVTTFDGIQKLLAVSGCSGLPEHAAKPSYNPRTSLYFRAHRTLVMEGYKAPTKSVRRKEDIRHFNQWNPFGIRCSPEIWVIYWWIPPTKKETQDGFCGSFVMDNYKQYRSSSAIDVRKVMESAPLALAQLTCQQLAFLANNKQFRYPASMDGNVYVGTEVAAKDAYDNYYNEYEDEYDDEDEFESGYNYYIDSLYDLYKWIGNRLQ